MASVVQVFRSRGSRRASGAFFELLEALSRARDQMGISLLSGDMLPACVVSVSRSFYAVALLS